MSKSEEIIETVKLEISKEELPAFVAYLAIGTLNEIRRGVVSSDVGIWSLGAPGNWEFLLNVPGISPEILKVFQTGDELSVLQEIKPETFDETIGELITILEKELAKMPEHNWHLSWST